MIFMYILLMLNPLIYNNWSLRNFDVIYTVVFKYILYKKLGNWYSFVIFRQMRGCQVTLSENKNFKILQSAEWDLCNVNHLQKNRWQTYSILSNFRFSLIKSADDLIIFKSHCHMFYLFIPNGFDFF